MKVTDLPDDDRRKLHDIVHTGAVQAGLSADYDYTTKNPITGREKLFGQCAGCKYLTSVFSEYGGIYAECKELTDLKLSPSDPVKECSEFQPRGSLSLNQMIDIAVLIDINKKEIGFIAKEN